MAQRIEKTVFISYRRTNFPWAYCIYQDLTHHGYDVFFDYQSIDSGSFEKVILENIKARAHFIIILSPSALERCNQPGDWLRREIETAIDEKRNIIPVMLEGFDFGSPLIKQALTGKLASLNSYNGMSLVAEYVEAGFEKLRNRFLNVALEDIQLHTLPDDAKEITEYQQAAANQAPPVGIEQLTSQEWFEKGYVFFEQNNFDESIRCYSEAILLNPTAPSFYNRGTIYGRYKGEVDNALNDFDEAIRIDPDFISAYVNRGNTLILIGDFDSALTSYNEAIQRSPNNASGYNGRGKLYSEMGEFDKAINDLTQAIDIDPDYAEPYGNRGAAYYRKGDYLSALKDYRIYVEMGGENKKDVEEFIPIVEEKLNPQ